jgi:hypothetical protein
MAQGDLIFATSVNNSNPNPCRLALAKQYILTPIPISPLPIYDLLCHRESDEVGRGDPRK